MNNNVHQLPVRRKAGRRRLHPVPDVPLADVLSITPQTPTADDMIADYEEAFVAVARGLLTAISAFTDFRHKYPRN